MASTSIPGLTRVALGSVAVPAGCWPGMALGACGGRAVSQDTLLRHGHRQTPGWRDLSAEQRVEVGFPETPGMFSPRQELSWLLGPARNGTPPCQHPACPWPGWAGDLEGGSSLFPQDPPELLGRG